MHTLIDARLDTAQSRSFLLLPPESSYLVKKHDSPVHMDTLVLIVAGRLHHVLRVTQQSQVHQLVVQAVFLQKEPYDHRKAARYLRWWGSPEAQPDLAQADGVIVGLGSGIEVHRLLDVLLALVLPGEMIGSRAVPRLICDLCGLQINTITQKVHILIKKKKQPAARQGSTLPSARSPDSSRPEPGTGSPGQTHSSGELTPSPTDSPDTGPTTYKGSCLTEHKQG